MRKEGGVMASKWPARIAGGAADALIGGALAAAVGAVLHDSFLLHEKNFGLRRQVVCPRT